MLSSLYTAQIHDISVLRTSLRCVPIIYVPRVLGHFASSFIVFVCQFQTRVLALLRVRFKTHVKALLRVCYQF